MLVLRAVLIKAFQYSYALKPNQFRAISTFAMYVSIFLVVPMFATYVWIIPGVPMCATFVSRAVRNIDT